MRNKLVSNSPRLRELRRKKHRALRSRVVIFLVVALIILIGLSFISWVNRFRIDEIIVSGNKVVETKDIALLIKDDIAGSYFWLFPRNNFLIYPKGKIRTELSTKYKRLKNISFNVKNPKTLEVTVSEYDGKYLWCGTTLPDLASSANQKCYFLDNDGYVFDEAPYFSGEVYFKFYGKPSGSVPGSYFLKNNWGNFTAFKQSLEEMHLKPSAFWLDENGEGNIGLSSELYLGPKIIFKMGDNYEKVAENLQSAITTEPLRTELKTKFSSLLYIDLSFGNKVYYKFSVPGGSTSGEQ